MLNTPRSRWIAAVSVATLLLSAGFAVAGHGEGPKHRARHQRMHRAMAQIDALSDEQAKAALDASKDLGRIRDDLRGKAAAIRLQAFRDAKASPEKRQEIRDAARAKVKALREELRVPFTEAGMKVVRTLTPEQRAAMVRDGKTPTDEQLARRLGKRLSRPGARAFLRARVEAGATTPPK